ncbi:MAG: hypothetical protein JWP30_136 [Homoserinimonas sp.]|jgi:hypothetical protein|nr:hypothetical protein [Mycetocola sp.]MCU1545036.1 hypothetical protein [Homoserinimonas sp.]
MISGAIRDVPVDPDADEARRWVAEELSDPRYEAARLTWFDRASSAFWDWLTSLSLEGVDGPAGLVLLLVGLAVVAVLVVAFLIFGLPALNRRSAVTASLFGVQDARSSGELRGAAEAAAGAHDWTLAIEERFRALARALTERTVVVTTPGTTAHGFAMRAAHSFPEWTDELLAAANNFDGVRYLGRDGTEAGYRRLSDLDAAIQGTRPNLVDDSASEGVNG